MISERPVDPRPEGLPDDRSELWYVCTGTINSHEPSDEVKLMALGIKRQLELEARAYHAERERDALRARVAELEGRVKSLTPLVDKERAVWFCVCTKCGKLTHRYGRHLVPISTIERSGTCEHCPYMNAFYLMDPQPNSIAELEAKGVAGE